MKSIHEALQLLNVDEIDKEVKERRDMIYQMVGQLYPRILEDEIFKLNCLKVKLMNTPPRSELLKEL